MPWKAQTLKPVGWVHPEKRRPNAAQRGYDHRWRKIRAEILQRDPVCVICHAARSDTVDHILTKARGGTDDPRNLRGLCRQCHSRKTVYVDDRWGRR